MVPRLLILAVLATASPAAAGPLDVAAGKALFARNWVSSPSTNRSDSGLGPLYDARSCASCHATGGESAGGRRGPVIRLGDARGQGDPVYGAQLQTQALAGLTREAAAEIDWNAQGPLRKPALELYAFAYGPLSGETHAGLRRAPPLAGVGLLAAIPDSELLSEAARERGEGGRGRVSILKSDEGRSRIGRWGWKAAGSDLGEQVALAMQRDIGLSTTLYPDPWGECTPAERSCREAAAASGAKRIDASDRMRRLIVAYLTSLPAPKAPDLGSEGYAIFRRAGCEDCHAIMKTADGARVYAMTDLLLHDMGPGLDDGIAEGAAKSFEWRTAPLWSISAEIQSGGLLHDGRARTVAQAVMWHGGEGAPARTRFAALSDLEKSELQAFLLKK